MNNRQQMEALLKPLLLPTVEMTYSPDKDLSAVEASVSSYFGGRPYIEDGESWPECKECHQAMEFVFQMNLQELPQPISKELQNFEFDLFAFYVCRACEYWPPFYELRTYRSDSKKISKLTTRPRLFPRFNIEMKSKLSLPDWDGIDELSDEIPSLSEESNSEEPWELFEVCSERLVQQSDPPENWFGVVGGYPNWIQGDETPICNKCGKSMKLFFELGNVEEANLTWMDFLSAIYLFYCPEHFEEQELVLQST